MSRRDLNAGYPGPDVASKPPVSKWDEQGNCISGAFACGHPRSEHGIRGCSHPRGEMDTCWCSVSGVS